MNEAGDDLRVLDVVLVEDHPTFRLGLRLRLEREADIHVVAEAATGQDALRLVTELSPDVVVVDLNLPDMSGIDVIRQLGLNMPGAAVLVLTMLDDESVFGALRAGARGYLLKDAEPSRIVAAIRSVALGETTFSPSVAGRLLAQLTEDAPSRQSAVFEDLSRREHDILALLAKGINNAEIARRLGLRTKTVRNYVSNVLTKL